MKINSDIVILKNKKFKNTNPANPVNPLALINPANPNILKILIQTVRKYNLILPAIILFIMLSSNLYALTPVIIDENTESVSLGRYMEILEDPTGKLTIDDVTKPEMNDKWFQSKQQLPNFGFTNNAYWFKMNLLKPSSVKKMLIKFGWSHYNELDYFLFDEQGRIIEKYNLGDYYVFKKRIINDKSFVIPLESSGNVSILIRLKSNDSLQIPIYLLSEKKYLEEIETDTLISGLILGCLLLMVIYNFFIYISIKNKNYLNYAYYLLAQLFFILSYFGYGFKYIWSDYSYFNNMSLPLSSCLVIMATFYFYKEFLEVKKHNDIISFMFRVMNLFLIIAIVMIFLKFIITSFILINITGNIGVFVIFITIVTSIYAGNRSGKYLLLAWVILLITTVFFMLKNSGLIMPYKFIDYAFFVGIFFEITLFSFALADRINIMKKEKEDAQNDALRVQKEATESLEQKVTERTSELAQANEKLRDLDRAKNDFIANISHELRTPLTLILSPVDDALSGRPMTGDSLEVMQRNGRNLLSLINDLLDVSRLTAGKMTLQVRETDLRAVLKHCCAEMESPAKMKGLTLVCDTGETSVNVYADEEKISHVISNFFSNSFKFTAAGGLIEVKVTSDGEDAVLTFSDTGCGIPEDKLATIFDRFTQADTSSTRRHEGTGIGLSIVKDLVELHGGTVSVKSRFIDEYPEDHGTVFTVKIPSGKSHLEGRTDIIFSEKPLHNPTLPHVRGIDAACAVSSAAGNFINTASESDLPVILVVEDNSDLRMMLENMLSGRFTVYTAGNGLEAINILEKVDEIDLVLSDIMMPGMDGHELLRWIRGDEKFEGLPVVFLTARADHFMKIEGLDLGAIDYVTKPFNSEELLLRIRNQMEQRRLRNSLIRNYNNISAKLKAVNVRNVTGENITKIENICAFIREHFMDDLTREQLASAAEINPDTFSRMFNQHTGKTLSDYVNELRVEEAKRRLSETGNTITRISIDTGFDNIRTFNRVFKKATGLTPGEFRVAKLKN